MTNRQAQLSLLLLSALTTGLLSASSAEAAAMSSLVDEVSVVPASLAESFSMMALESGPVEPVSADAPPLSSGGQGCFDPSSWVWQAPRAERVTLDWPVESVWQTQSSALGVPLPAERLCEIGRPGCERRPESLPDDELVSALEAATLTCALKRAHHENGANEVPFDDKSCLESEMTVWTVELDAEEPRPFEGPSCSTSDPECLPMPPLPEAPGPLAQAPSAVVTPLAPATDDIAEMLPEPEVGVALRGVCRRVERPPTT